MQNVMLNEKKTKRQAKHVACSLSFVSSSIIDAFKLTLHNLLLKPKKLKRQITCHVTMSGRFEATDNRQTFRLATIVSVDFFLFGELAAGTIILFPEHTPYEHKPRSCRQKETVPYINQLNI
jgi:hypothetical protein